MFSEFKLRSDRNTIDLKVLWMDESHYTYFNFRVDVVDVQLRATISEMQATFDERMEAS